MSSLSLGRDTKPRLLYIRYERKVEIKNCESLDKNRPITHSDYVKAKIGNTEKERWWEIKKGEKER